MIRAALLAASMLAATPLAARSGATIRRQSLSPRHLAAASSARNGHSSGSIEPHFVPARPLRCPGPS